MKNFSELNLQSLSAEEQTTINGGSEFSEDVVQGIGWLVGAYYATWKEYYIKTQAEKYTRM